MSEQQSTGFMQELDHWTEATIIEPLVSEEGERDEFVGEETFEQIKKAIREKVLESYRNGQNSMKITKVLLPHAREARINGKWVKGGRYNEPQQ